MLPLALLAIEDESDRTFMIGLYEEHKKLMMNKARIMMESDEEAFEAVSDACVKLIAHVDTLRQLPGVSLRRYVVVTVEHAAIDLIRKRRAESRFSFLADDEVFKALPTREETADEAIIRAGERKALKDAIAQMSDRDRWVMSMRYDEQLSHREMAKRLHVKEKSVSVILDRTHKRLRAILEKEGFCEP